MAADSDEKDYSQLISDLANGKLDELKIHPEEFMSFQKAYHRSPDANKIEGMAQHNGLIIYRVKK